MVTMQACSPLTARLSIWMSFCGLRPIVTRSLSRVTSLITEPSRLRINFAMVVIPVVYPNQDFSFANQPVRAG